MSGQGGLLGEVYKLGLTEAEVEDRLPDLRPWLDQPGPAALTVTQLLIAAAVLDAHGPKTPGAKAALAAIQQAIDTHPDAKRGDDQ